MPIAALSAQLPAYAKDIATNLTVLVEETVLSDQAKWGTFLASACAIGEPETLRAITMAAREAGLTPEAFDAAKTAAAIMAMNNVYFRALHIMESTDYDHLPSRLRMNRLRHPGVDPIDYELWCVAVSAINACGACLDSHEAELRRRNTPPVQVQAALRIAAVIHAAARVLAVESLDRPQFSGV